VTSVPRRASEVIRVESLALRDPDRVALYAAADSTAIQQISVTSSGAIGGNGSGA
jgi:hypothetical protein